MIGVAAILAAAEIDALAAKAAATVGEWTWTGDSYGGSGIGAVYESHGCETVVGPFADAACVTLEAMNLGRVWKGEAVLMNSDGGWMASSSVQPAGRRGWPSHTEAIEALEAALTGAPEAAGLVITLIPGTGFGEDRPRAQTWDWLAGCWVEVP